MMHDIFRRVTKRHKVPEQWALSKIVDLPLLALDLELTSLDPNDTEILSVAWVASSANTVDLGSGREVVSRCDPSLHQSPTIHGITAETLHAGQDLSETLATLAEKAASHVWVLHNADLDLAALYRRWQLLGLKPSICCIDTMLLRLYEVRKHYEAMPSGIATLSASCQSHGLPAFKAHRALDDAHATLLLLFAQLYQLDKKQNLRLEDLRHTQALRFFGY